MLIEQVPVGYAVTTGCGGRCLPGGCTGLSARDGWARMHPGGLSRRPDPNLRLAVGIRRVSGRRGAFIKHSQARSCLDAVGALASTAVRTGEEGLLEDLVAVDDMPDLDAVVPCAFAELLEDPSDTCEQQATVLLTVSCPAMHADHTEQLLMCDEHDRWLADHQIPLLILAHLIVVKRVPL